MIEWTAQVKTEKKPLGSQKTAKKRLKSSRKVRSLLRTFLNYKKAINNLGSENSTKKAEVNRKRKEN